MSFTPKTPYTIPLQDTLGEKPIFTHFNHRAPGFPSPRLPGLRRHSPRPQPSAAPTATNPPAISQAKSPLRPIGLNDLPQNSPNSDLPNPIFESTTVFATNAAPIVPRRHISPPTRGKIPRDRSKVAARRSAPFDYHFHPHSAGRRPVRPRHPPLRLPHHRHQRTRPRHHQPPDQRNGEMRANPEDGTGAVCAGGVTEPVRPC
jgi:hypothetical protein